MSTTPGSVYEWQDLPWRSLEQQVFKLQKRIYRAAQRKDSHTVHRLQRLLVRSWAARCLAVRIVTQDNRGKRTAGVDGVRALTPPQRLELARELRLSPKAYPTRRVWIPKPGTTEKRPLGIPTLRNRAEQTLARLALEPEWEAYFEPNSYGFRPGRSCQDAIAQIFLSINRKPKYVFDADIAKCFDHIQHEALLKKLHTYPALRRVIRAWLKAGVMEAGQWAPTPEGTPQGGAISPLLANVALHGLEQVVTAAFRRHHTPNVIRFADDFVVLHPELAAIEKTQTILAAWLAEMGLELKPSKTRITHTLEDYRGNLGFDFLGFHIRQFRMGQTHTGRSTHGEPLGFKTLIQPSPEAIRRHYEELKAIIDRNLMAPQAQLIAQLNPVIRGWANYYSAVVSKRTFSGSSAVLWTSWTIASISNSGNGPTVVIPATPIAGLSASIGVWKVGAGRLARRTGKRFSSPIPECPFNATSRCVERRVPSMGAGCIGPPVWGASRNYHLAMPTCLNASGAAVPGAICSSSKATALNSITLFPKHRVVRKGMRTGNCCMDTAMIKRRW
jgi:RNA-directed DNA polymerase